MCRDMSTDDKAQLGEWTFLGDRRMVCSDSGTPLMTSLLCLVGESREQVLFNKMGSPPLWVNNYSYLYIYMCKCNRLLPSVGPKTNS